MGSLHGLRLAAEKREGRERNINDDRESLIGCLLYIPHGDPARKPGNCFRLCERDASSSIRLTRNSDWKRINGFCTKLQESPKPPSQTYSHRVPLHKPTDWERKILIWAGRFKKEEEIPETISFEMLDVAKNKLRVKISYVMIALTVAGCILMVIEGKQAVKRHESLTSLNLEKKARLREEAAMKAKTE